MHLGCWIKNAFHKQLMHFTSKAAKQAFLSCAIRVCPLLCRTDGNISYMEKNELAEEDPVQGMGVGMDVNHLSLHQGFGKFCSERRMPLHVGGWLHSPTMPARWAAICISVLS